MQRYIGARNIDVLRRLRTSHGTAVHITVIAYVIGI